jgi:hypothetical protein
LWLSLVLEYLWWCTVDGFSETPATISGEAYKAAALLVGDGPLSGDRSENRPFV